MEDKQWKDLVKYLNRLGFEGEQMEVAIRNNLQIGMPLFTIDHSVHFGEDRMDFVLRFSTMEGSTLPVLEGYKATYKPKTDIEHTVHNGIDTRKLEEVMGGIDWHAFFLSTDQSSQAVDNKDDIAKTVKSLTVLWNSPDIVANEIHQQLTFKYWPRDVYELYKHPQVRHMEIEYARSMEFSAKGSSIYNARLAYLIVSDKVSDIVDQLESGLDLEVYPGIDINEAVLSALSSNKEILEIKMDHNEPEGLIEYCIPIKSDGHDLKIEVCKATFTPHPKITHGVFNGVDSEVLEKMMQEINWRDDTELFRVDEEMDEPQFLPKVAQAQEQIYRLSQDLVGSNIADALQLKYWIDVAFFSDAIPQTAWDEFNQAPRIEVEFPLDYSARNIFNLMCGRAVFRQRANEIGHDEGIWERLHTVQGDNKNPKKSPKNIKGFTEKELEQQLSMLPISNHIFYPVKRAVMEGSSPTVNTSDGKKMTIEAYPENSELRLYSGEGKPIPFNFRFDPDWRPEHTISSDITQEQTEGKKMTIRKTKGKKL